MEFQQTLDEVTRVSIDLLLKEPYYAHILSCLNKEVVSEGHNVTTMAVGCRKLNHVLYINDDFWNKFLTSKDHRLGVFKHEVLHIVLKHTLVDSSKYDAHLVNIAMDLVVNQLIERQQLPDESIFLDTFPELNLEEERGWFYYYQKLKELQQNANGEYNDSEALSNLEAIEPNTHGLDRHSTWFELQKLNELDKSLVENSVDYLIALAHGKTPYSFWGSLPASLRIYLESIIKPKPAYVDWRKALRLYSASSRKTFLKSTLKRPSRRYRTVPGIKIQRKQKLLVAVDTSGSVSKEELTEFFQELYHIYRSGSEIRVVECDAEISNTYEYKGRMPVFVKGGGGTDFTPPVIYGNKQFLPDALIYFTDGFAPSPQVKARFPIMWIVTENGLESDHDAFKSLPGIKVKMNNKSNAEERSV